MLADRKPLRIPAVFDLEFTNTMSAQYLHVGPFGWLVRRRTAGSGTMSAAPRSYLKIRWILSFTKSSGTKRCHSYSMKGSLPFSCPLRCITRNFAVASGQIMRTPMLMSIERR